MKKVTMCFIAFALTASAFSQDTAAVQMFGKIFDKNKKPVSGVKIELKDTKFFTVTNGEGSYFFMLPPKKGTLVYKRKGYITREVEFTGTPQANDLVLTEEM